MTMELQLGLALPSINPIKGLDLNSLGYESTQILGLDLLNHHQLQGYGLKRKRSSFDESFEEKNIQLPQTLPLFFCRDNQPNDGDDDHPEDLDINSFITNKNDGDQNVTIGWPPIKSWRKKHCHQIHGGGYQCVGNGGDGHRRSNSKFVKVKMERVGIARKVDLNLHHSYETLLETLLGMFGKCHEDVNAYKLTYQDREGDWMLLSGDVAWRTFIGSVQRLRLQKSNC